MNIRAFAAVGTVIMALGLGGFVFTGPAHAPEISIKPVTVHHNHRVKVEIGVGGQEAKAPKQGQKAKPARKRTEKPVDAKQGPAAPIPAARPAEAPQPAPPKAKGGFMESLRNLWR